MGSQSFNAAWLVLAVIVFNLTRAAATLAEGDTTTGRGRGLARATTATTATTATIRRKLIAVPARVASSARRITVHLPQGWPWETAWTQLFTHGCGPPAAAART